MIHLVAPENGAKVSLLTENQKTFLDISMNQQMSALQTDSEKMLNWLNPERSESVDCSAAGNVLFMFEVEPASAENTGTEPVHFLLSEQPNFQDAYIQVTMESRLSVNNLKSNTTYYWKVNDSDVYTFTTEDCVPRWIAVDGVSNVRDMGNWRTINGCKVRQGLIYRGSELDFHQMITPLGIHTMREKLRIRTDLDLRGEAVGKVTVSPLGEDIRYLQVPVFAYENFMAQTPEKKETVCRLFEILADECNYPIYFHCWGGADRTGTLAFLLNAVLGVPAESLILDYELTTLSLWGPRERGYKNFQLFLEELEKYQGTNYNEKAVSYLRNCGVKDTTIETLCRNLLCPEVTTL